MGEKNMEGGGVVVVLAGALDKGTKQDTGTVAYSGQYGGERGKDSMHFVLQ